MKHYLRSRLAALLAPRTWLLAAAVVTAVFAATHAAGWRESMSLISGTLPEGEHLRFLGAVKFATYFLSYFACVVGAPIALIAAALYPLFKPR